MTFSLNDVFVPFAFRSHISVVFIVSLVNINAYHQVLSVVSVIMNHYHFGRCCGGDGGGHCSSFSGRKTDNTVVSRVYFQSATGGVYHQLWEGVQKFSKNDPRMMTRSIDKQLAMVKQGRYVLIMDRTPLLVQVISDHTCELVLLSETFMPLPFGIGLQKNSPYKAAIYEGLVLVLNAIKWQEMLSTYVSMNVHVGKHACPNICVCV